MKSVNSHRLKPWLNPSNSRIINLEDDKDSMEPPSKKKEWVLGLSTEDRQIIEKGGMLNDKHINAAHKLLQKKFPQCGGCQSSLLSQNQGFNALVKEGEGLSLNSIFCMDMHLCTLFVLLCRCPNTS